MVNLAIPSYFHPPPLPTGPISSTTGHKVGFFSLYSYSRLLVIPNFTTPPPPPRPPQGVKVRGVNSIRSLLSLCTYRFIELHPPPSPTSVTSPPPEITCEGRFFFSFYGAIPGIPRIPGIPVPYCGIPCFPNYPFSRNIKKETGNGA